jgi:glycosyltransferase involved in cell wall biosynthesis
MSKSAAATIAMIIFSAVPDEPALSARMSTDQGQQRIRLHEARSFPMNPERKRILFLVPAFARGVGGAERVISTLLRHLDHSRFECHLALVGAGGAYLDRVPASVTVHHLGVSRMRYSLPSIIKLVRRLRPQTILSTVVHLNVMLMLARPFLPGRPVILLREAILPSAFLAQETAHPRVWRWLYRHLYPKADRIICLFDGMVDDMAEQMGVSRNKLVRIYNPVDTEMVRRLAKAGETPYRGAGPHIVAVGRLQHQKGYDVLLSAFPAVLHAIPGARLAILGEGPLEAQLKEQAAKIGVNHAVSFMGFQANPWPYVQHADLFVLPSRFEGLPNALLEVLALGGAVVATDCPGGVREIEKASGKIILVPPEAPGALAEAMIAVLKKPKVDHLQRERWSACPKEFDVQQVVEQYSRLF